MTRTQQEELYEMAWTVWQPRQALKHQLHGKMRTELPEAQTSLTDVD